MSVDDFGFLANDNLPSRETIVAMCKEAGDERHGLPLRNQLSDPIAAWVKYGINVTMAEALMQDWVAKALSASPAPGVRVPRVYDAFLSTDPDWPFGYIVMEYIDTPDGDKKDYKPVAKAVQALISLSGPSLAPGPVGGGLIIHSFFPDGESGITYDTVEELQLHMNGLLRYMGDTRRVDLVADAHDGLRLCPCDITPSNFKKCQDGMVVALDFEAACFLPPSFFAVAMEKPVNIFSQKVARYIDYPKSEDVKAMVAASYFLVPRGYNTILGMPKALRQRKGLP